MRALGTSAGILGPILLAVGLTVMVGPEYAPLVVTEGVLVSVLAGIAVWVQGRRRQRVERMLSARLGEAAELRRQALGTTKDLGPIRANIDSWITYTRAYLERQAPQFLAQWDAPLPPRSYRYPVEHQAQSELAVTLDERIAVLRDFLAELRSP